MNHNRYNISYGAPLTVKDRPHRALDTARDIYNVPELDESMGEQSFVVIHDLDTSDAVAILPTEVIEVEAADTDRLNKVPAIRSAVF